VGGRQVVAPGGVAAEAAVARRPDVRNVAIVAHVDHGKTTLVDAILRQTGAVRANQPVGERILDTGELERERGITILAKNTAVRYRGVKVNIVDTPGHADFGGEVERILSMVDGALLVVDAAEGPMPQTRFVLQKALAARLQPVLVVNKLDRPDADPWGTVDRVLDLFLALGADEDQLDFPVVFASGRLGVAVRELPEDWRSRGLAGDIRPLLDAILEAVPPPACAAEGPLQMLVTTLDYDDYVGRIGIGRVLRGVLAAGAPVAAQHGPGAPLRVARAAQVYTFENLRRLPTERVEAGDVAAVAGIEGLTVGDTVTSPEDPRPLPPLAVDPPTLTVVVYVNGSPFAGREGTYVTSRQLRERLWREAEHNVGLEVAEGPAPDAFVVRGRGELHLAVLLETMRREGYEFEVGRPEVVLRQGPAGLEEPLEELVADVPAAAVGAILEAMGPRRGELTAMEQVGDRVRLRLIVPARGLVGFAAEFQTLTKGQGVMGHTFAGWGPHRGPIPGRARGSLVAWEDGVTTAYALENAELRGALFVGPGEAVYAGQVVGEHARPGDLEINVCKRKHLTNMRSSTGEEEIQLTPPRRLTLEEALAFIREDERVEVTPRAIRVRKAVRDRHARARLRAAAQAQSTGTA
jgi:GTP-binding protein